MLLSLTNILRSSYLKFRYVSSEFIVCYCLQVAGTLPEPWSGSGLVSSAEHSPQSSVFVNSFSGSPFALFRSHRFPYLDHRPSLMMNNLHLLRLHPRIDSRILHHLRAHCR